MKYFICFSLLLLSGIVNAQTSSQSDPANPANANQQATKPVNPNISITPAISTTVTSQPPSYPGSNTNPTTGTVIGLKPNKKEVNADRSKVSVVSDSLLKKDQKSSVPSKKTARKNKRAVKR